MDDFDEWYGQLEEAAEHAGYEDYLVGLTDAVKEQYFDQYPDDPTEAMEAIVHESGG